MPGLSGTDRWCSGLWIPHPSCSEIFSIPMIYFSGLRLRNRVSGWGKPNSECSGWHYFLAACFRPSRRTNYRGICRNICACCPCLREVCLPWLHLGPSGRKLCSLGPFSEAFPIPCQSTRSSGSPSSSRVQIWATQVVCWPKSHSIYCFLQAVHLDKP